jgi:hypothetical protein
MHGVQVVRQLGGEGLFVEAGGGEVPLFASTGLSHLGTRAAACGPGVALKGALPVGREVSSPASASPRADDYNERNRPFTRQIDNVTVALK